MRTYAPSEIKSLTNQEKHRKGRTEIQTAELSFGSELYDSCVSALYYSAFQYVTALILTKGENVSSKHTYVRGWVNKNLGATGTMPLELVKLYNRLMDHRSEADYSVTVSFSKDKVSDLMEQVRTSGPDTAARARFRNRFLDYIKTSPSCNCRSGKSR
ncbi:HEPN domain-containing protein [Paenibacillus sabuli]